MKIRYSRILKMWCWEDGNRLYYRRSLWALLLAPKLSGWNPKRNPE